LIVANIMFIFHRDASNTRFSTYLDELVPTAGDDDRVLRVRAETDARDPVGVALVGDGVLAVTEGVPQLDSSVARAGNNLTVVGRERNGKNVVGVADKSPSSGTGSQLPKSQGLVPRGGQGVRAIGGNDLY
jgi:hypothetical protein